MTTEIALTLGLLGAAMLFLVSGWLRSDLVALLVLLGLTFGGLVTPAEALSGFSNPAVVTVWAMFILGAGLARTGVANLIGRKILNISGGSEAGFIIAMMFVVAGLSAFMSSTAIVAMFLPIISYVARKEKLPVSRLLMPLAFGTLLGGVNTLIGTPPNILVSNALQEFRGQEFQFFDFLKVGLPVTLGGIAFMVVIGRRLLPRQDRVRGAGRVTSEQAEKLYELEERLFSLSLPAGSTLAGKRLDESRLGTALKVNVLSIHRNGKRLLAPGPETVLQEGDELIVLGKGDWLEVLVAGQLLVLNQNGNGTDERLSAQNLVSSQISLLEVSVSAESALCNQSLSQVNFRKKYGANVLALWRNNRAIRTNFQDTELKPGDRLLLQASRAQIQKLRELNEFHTEDQEAVKAYQLEERLLLFAVPEGSTLTGRTLAQSELGDSFGLSVLGIMRNGKTKLMPKPGEKLLAGDQLVIEGKLEDVELLHAMQKLQVGDDALPPIGELENEEIGLVEAVVSPHSKLGGKTLRDLEFREKFGLSVLAIWRGDRPYRSNLRELPLHPGDSVLLYGDRERIKMLAHEGEFLILSQDVQDPPRRDRAAIAAIIMLGVVSAAGFNIMPIEIAAVAGAAAMVLARCLTMDEAQRSIQWPAVFLVAGMLPLGIALQNTGTAEFIGAQVFAQADGWSITQVLLALFIASNLLAQVLSPPIVAVLMSSLVLNNVASFHASPQALLITIALSSAMPFLSPISHPANLLVMGPGGYRFGDYTKVGFLLTIFVMLIAVVTIPYFWP
jgi:di/tricarboxylate transporter